MGLRITIKHQRKIVIAGVIGLVVGAATSSVAFASIPDNRGVIHSCRDNSDGSIRIIDSASASCSGGETALNWNVASAGQFVSNLIGADFSGASLSYRNLIDQDIHGGTFSGTILNGADFTGANLSASTFDGSGVAVQAKNTNFSNANLNDSTITGAIDATGANFNGTTFNNTSWASSNVINGDFRSANLTNTQLNGTFETANFSGVNFAGVQLFGPTLNNSNLSDAVLGNMTITAATQFQYGTLAGADFTDATVSATFRYLTLTGADFTGANFVNADLQLTDFSQATLTNTTWSNTLCPDGTNSNNNGNTCVGHLAP